MTKTPDIDLQAAHKYFAAECFNKAWDLIEKADRAPEENEEMVRLSQASLWHWTQREDCTDKNLSISYWQLSRIYALLGQVDNARGYGQLCLQYSQDEGPFYLGYAYEALARAESVAGDKEKMGEYLRQARRLAEAVADSEDRHLLVKDLETIN